MFMHRVAPVASRLVCRGLIALGSVLFTVQAFAALIFEYEGRVRSVGGTVTDGSLLPFQVGDLIAGSFTFDPSGATPSQQSPTYENVITNWRFGAFDARSAAFYGHSTLNLNEPPGTLFAGVQVHTGDIYDTYALWLDPTGGPSPITSVDQDLSTLALEQFVGDNLTTLLRVDLASSGPIRFTEANASLTRLTIRSVPEPSTVSLMLFALACVAAVRARRSVAAG